MQPEGTHRAASWPSSSATRASSRSSVGSRSSTSSPTSAAAMAARISGEGWVTVSERRAMGRMERFKHAWHTGASLEFECIFSTPSSWD